MGLEMDPLCTSLVVAHSVAFWPYRELTLQKGDIVYIHKEVDRNWLEGEHHGRVGIFPANYVEVSGQRGERYWVPSDFNA